MSVPCSVIWYWLFDWRPPTLMMGGFCGKARMPATFESLGVSSAMTWSAESLRSLRGLSRMKKRP